MSIKKRSILLWVFLLTVSAHSIAQEIYFGYDSKGNMIRKYITLKSAQAYKVDSSENAYNERIEEKFGELLVEIFPNPTSSMLNIEVTPGKEEIAGVNYQIMNLSGMTLLNKTSESSGFSIDMSSYEKGGYILILTINNQSTKWKVIKE